MAKRPVPILDPDATPADRFEAWLTEQRAIGTLARPSSTRWERWRNDAGAFLALAGILAAVWAYGRLTGRW